MDAGITPKPIYEYLVAPFIQEFFNSTIMKNRPDIDTVIKANTNMLLDY